MKRFESKQSNSRIVGLVILTQFQRIIRCEGHTASY